MSVDNRDIREEMRLMEDKLKTLSEEIEKLSNSQNSLKTTVDSANTSFQGISNNLNDMMTKVNKLYEQSETSMMDRILNQRVGNMSMMGMLGSTTKKLAIGVVSAGMIFSDIAMESLSSAREGLEDIVAEAQYMNRKRKADIQRRVSEFEEHISPS